MGILYLSGSCGGIFSGPSSIIRSPHYPNNYENNLECVYYITVETGKVQCPFFRKHITNNMQKVLFVIWIITIVMSVFMGRMLLICPHLYYGFQVIVFTFTDIDLESHSSCNFDSVTVHDGESINARSLGKFCGTVAPPPSTTSGNAGTVRFKTDGSTTRTGFSIDYVARDGW